MKNKHEILPGLTTTDHSDWKRKINEIKGYGMKKIALFLTGAGLEERKEIYSNLEETGLKEIPHVHARQDMELWEFDYLSRKYNTQLFNTHADFGDVFLEKFPSYISKVYIENTIGIPNEGVLEKFGGLCIDFSHWENMVLCDGGDKGALGLKMRHLAESFPVGCSHVSAIKEEAFLEYPSDSFKIYASHVIDNLSEVDYVGKYEEFLPHFISIELENSFADQLEVKDYLEKIVISKD